MTADRFARIAGTGSALPARLVPNSYFEAFVDTSDEWIRDRTGIEARHFAGPTETTATLSADAAAAALRATGVSPAGVDLLIVATCTPDRLIPSCAALVQARLGMNGPAFDLNAACAGFVYSLSVAAAQISSGAADRVLVVGAEVLSRVLNMTDRNTCVLFGDGAGAVLLEPGTEPGVIDSLLSMDGTQADQITQPGGGSEQPATMDSVAARRHTLHMPDGQAVFKRAVVEMADACSSVLEKAGYEARDVDAVVAHQANARIISMVGRRLGIDPGRVFYDIAEVGNTSAASIPIALDRAWRRSRLGAGDLVLTVAFGAGFAWGANLIRWTAPLPSAVDAVEV